MWRHITVNGPEEFRRKAGNKKKITKVKRQKKKIEREKKRKKERN